MEDFFANLFVEAKKEPVIEVDDYYTSSSDVETPKVVKVEPYRDFNRSGRSSAKELKSRAFNEPLMCELSQLMKPCNKHCLLGRKCLEPIPVSELFRIRKELWNDIDAPAPLDKERGKRLLDYLTGSKTDANGNLTFLLESSHLVCEGAFLRLLGTLPNSTNPSDTAPLWSRLKAEFKSGDPASLFTKEKMKLDQKDTFTQLKGEAKSYILAVCADYADSFVTVTSTGTIASDP